MYEHSIVPKHLPGGGGWSVKLYTLETYGQNQTTTSHYVDI